MKDELSYARLKARQRERRSGFPEAMALRIHRSISWIGRAEAENDDLDARFLFLWIAFNAAYACEDPFSPSHFGERGIFEEFFGKTTERDADGRIHRALWENFSGPIGRLMDNRYLFGPFWKHWNGIDGYENWEDRFDKAKRHFKRILENRDSAKVLSFVFDRLYVLRNQLMHGAATWNGKVNRSQIRDGAAVLGFLTPAFVAVMMDNPHADWGKPFYPPVVD